MNSSPWFADSPDNSSFYIHLCLSISSLSHPAGKERYLTAISTSAGDSSSSSPGAHKAASTMSTSIIPPASTATLREMTRRAKALAACSSLQPASTPPLQPPSLSDHPLRLVRWFRGANTTTPSLFFDKYIPSTSLIQVISPSHKTTSPSVTQSAAQSTWLGSTSLNQRLAAFAFPTHHTLLDTSAPPPNPSLSTSSERATSTPSDDPSSSASLGNSKYINDPRSKPLISSPQPFSSSRPPLFSSPIPSTLPSNPPVSPAFIRMARRQLLAKTGDGANLLGETAYFLFNALRPLPPILPLFRQPLRSAFSSSSPFVVSQESAHSGVASPLRDQSSLHPAAGLAAKAALLNASLTTSSSPPTSSSPSPHRATTHISLLLSAEDQQMLHTRARDRFLHYLRLHESHVWNELVRIEEVKADATRTRLYNDSNLPTSLTSSTPRSAYSSPSSSSNPLSPRHRRQHSQSSSHSPRPDTAPSYPAQSIPPSSSSFSLTTLSPSSLSEHHPHSLSITLSVLPDDNHQPVPHPSTPSSSRSTFSHRSRPSSASSHRPTPMSLSPLSPSTPTSSSSSFPSSLSSPSPTTPRGRPQTPTAHHRRGESNANTSTLSQSVRTAILSVIETETSLLDNGDTNGRNSNDSNNDNVTIEGQGTRDNDSESTYSISPPHHIRAINNNNRMNTPVLSITQRGGSGTKDVIESNAHCDSLLHDMLLQRQLCRGVIKQAQDTLSTTSPTRVSSSTSSSSSSSSAGVFSFGIPERSSSTLTDATPPPSAPTSSMSVPTIFRPYSRSSNTVHKPDSAQAMLTSAGISAYWPKEQGEETKKKSITNMDTQQGEAMADRDTERRSRQGRRQRDIDLTRRAPRDEVREEKSTPSKRNKHSMNLPPLPRSQLQAVEDWQVMSRLLTLRYYKARESMADAALGKDMKNAVASALMK